MNREVRNVFGQSPGPCEVSWSIPWLRVRSSKAAAASALRMNRIAWAGKSGSATGTSRAPACRKASSASFSIAALASSRARAPGVPAASGDGGSKSAGR